MAVKIPEDIQQFLQGKQGWVATASKDGMPNIAIKGSLRLLDDEHLMFADLFSKKTQENLSENPQVAVMVYDDQVRKSYLFKGTAEPITAGLLFDQTVEWVKKMNPKLPTPHAVVRITEATIFDQSSGPNAGKQIA